MKRPILHEIPLHEVVPGPGTMMITINPGAWDKLIASAYDNGWVLLVIKDEVPIKAYQKPSHEIRGSN